jgi:hypothetical protein
MPLSARPCRNKRGSLPRMCRADLFEQSTYASEPFDGDHETEDNDMSDRYRLVRRRNVTPGPM